MTNTFLFPYFNESTTETELKEIEKAILYGGYENQDELSHIEIQLFMKNEEKKKQEVVISFVKEPLKKGTVQRKEMWFFQPETKKLNRKKEVVSEELTNKDTLALYLYLLNTNHEDEQLNMFMNEVLKPTFVKIKFPIIVKEKYTEAYKKAITRKEIFHILFNKGYGEGKWAQDLTPKEIKEQLEFEQRFKPAKLFVDNNQKYGSDATKKTRKEKLQDFLWFCLEQDKEFTFDVIEKDPTLIYSYIYSLEGQSNSTITGFQGIIIAYLESKGVNTKEIKTRIKDIRSHVDVKKKSISKDVVSSENVKRIQDLIPAIRKHYQTLIAFRERELTDKIKDVGGLNEQGDNIKNSKILLHLHNLLLIASRDHAIFELIIHHGLDVSVISSLTRSNYTNRALKNVTHYSRKEILGTRTVYLKKRVFEAIDYYLTQRDAIEFNKEGPLFIGHRRFVDKNQHLRLHEEQVCGRATIQRALSFKREVEKDGMKQTESDVVFSTEEMQEILIYTYLSEHFEKQKNQIIKSAVHEYGKPKMVERIYRSIELEKSNLPELDKRKKRV